MKNFMNKLKRIKGTDVSRGAFSASRMSTGSRLDKSVLSNRSRSRPASEMDMSAYRRQYEHYLITRVDVPKIKEHTINRSRRETQDSLNLKKPALPSIREVAPLRSRPRPPANNTHNSRSGSPSVQQNTYMRFALPGKKSNHRFKMNRTVD